MEDEGFFVCSAFSVAGSIAVKAYLEVRMVMMMMMMIMVMMLMLLQVTAMADEPPPIINVGPANQTLPLNTLAVLPCEASGEIILIQ